MMRSLIRILVVTLFFMGVFPSIVLAQEKTLLYYDSHENEILPDARVAFKNGQYDRAAQLCEWYLAIVGDGSESTLHEKSVECVELIRAMREMLASGSIKEAKLKASALLAINPDDSAAKATLMLEEPAPAVPDTLEVTPPKDTVQVEKPVIVEAPPTTVVEEKPEDPVFSPVEEKPVSQPSVELKTPDNEPIVTYKPHARFVIKAGASILDFKQIAKTVAPGGTIGLYDLGGSRVGLEAGGYVCPGLSKLSASLFGVDAGLVIRVARGIYPKLGVGFFSCKSTERSDAPTKGLCAGASLVLLSDGHFCFEIGAKYYPAVKVNGSESFSTAGVIYDFPATREILPGGIAPEIRIGVAF